VRSYSPLTRGVLAAQAHGGFTSTYNTIGSGAGLSLYDILLATGRFGELARSRLRSHREDDADRIDAVCLLDAQGWAKAGDDVQSAPPELGRRGAGNRGRETRASVAHVERNDAPRLARCDDFDRAGSVPNDVRDEFAKDDFSRVAVRFRRTRLSKKRDEGAPSLAGLAHLDRLELPSQSAPAF
jgi:hypothetical protein